jgi:hypothetical protein
MPTYIKRYLAGERVEVWNELMALGEAVPHKPVQADANRVVEETMRRARHNIEELITRLSGMGYRFAAPAIERGLEKINKQIAEPKINSYTLRLLEQAVAAGKLPASALNPKERPGFQEWLATLQSEKAALEAELERMATMPPLENPRIFYEPEQQTAKNCRDIEKVTNGPLPLSIRSWYKHVGYVSFAGSHPALNPDGSATADPLVIRPVAEIMGGLVSGRQNGRTVLTLSVSDLNKAGLEGGKPYRIWLPNPCVDVELENAWRQTTFVGYLRRAFEWGGFPGWERDPSPPRDIIAELTEGLLPI